MKQRITLIAACMLGMANDGRAQAAAEVKLATPSSDANIYTGDRVKFQYARLVTKVDATVPLADGKLATSLVCLPAFSTLRGIGVLSVDKQNRPAFIVTAVESDPRPLSFFDELATRPSAPKPEQRCLTGSLAKVDDLVVVDQDTISTTHPDRFGLTFGTLMVPYKFHLAGDHNFSGGATLGGYIGFRQEKSGWWGLGLQYIAFVGAAAVEVPQTVDGQTKSLSVNGLSYGIGILGTVKDSFHMGFVVGADRVGADAKYARNGKPWLALSLGYAFSN